MTIFRRTRKFLNNIKELSDLKERVLKLEKKEREIEVVVELLKSTDENFNKQFKRAREDMSELKKDIRLLVNRLIK